MLSILMPLSPALHARRGRRILVSQPLSYRQPLSCRGITMLENLRRRALRLPAYLSTISEGCAVGPASALPQVLDGKRPRFRPAIVSEGFEPPWGQAFPANPPQGMTARAEPAS